MDRKKLVQQAKDIFIKEDKLNILMPMTNITFNDVFKILDRYEGEVNDLAEDIQDDKVFFELKNWNYQYGSDEMLTHMALFDLGEIFTDFLWDNGYMQKDRSKW